MKIEDLEKELIKSNELKDSMELKLKELEDINNSHQKDSQKELKIDDEELKERV